MTEWMRRIGRLRPVRAALAVRWNGITTKLLLTFFSILLASFAISTLLSYFFFHSELKNRHSAFDDRQLDVTAALVRSAYRERWNEDMLQSALKMAAGPEDRTLYVLDRYGRVLYQTGKEALSPDVDANLVRKVLRTGAKIREAVSPSGNREVTLSIGPIMAPPGASAQVIVIQSRAFQREFSLFTGVYRNVILISLVLSALIVAFVSRGATARLRKMSEVALSIAKGRFDVKADVGSRDEIGMLAEALNHMSDELASLDRMRREFVANVSHDLRSPLTSIGGYVEALIDGAVPKEKERHYLGLIREQTVRMNRLVNDLLDVARMEAGQLNISPAPYNLTEWIRRLLARMEPEFARRGLRFRLAGEAEDVWVRADPDRIDQVLSNLVLNAMQFSPAGKTVEVSVVRDGRQAVVAVRDEGPGIPPEELERIWQRFYKSDKARTAHTGTGLGLAIVRHLLEKHGASPRVESKVGEGSRFSFALPLAEPAPASRSPSHPRLPQA